VTGDPQFCTCPVAWLGIYPPPPCPSCRERNMASGWNVPYQAPGLPAQLSDDDIDRIAERVAELIGAIPTQSEPKTEQITVLGATFDKMRRA
jgi:hypothetical protein